MDSLVDIEHLRAALLSEVNAEAEEETEHWQTRITAAVSYGELFAVEEEWEQKHCPHWGPFTVLIER